MVIEKRDKATLLNVAPKVLSLRAALTVRVARHYNGGIACLLTTHAAANKTKSPKCKDFGDLWLLCLRIASRKNS
jgi:hypothetical protein